MQQRQKKLAKSFRMGHNVSTVRQYYRTVRMIRMKKIVTVLVVLALALALTACNGGKKSASSSDLAAVQAVAAEEKL